VAGDGQEKQLVWVAGDGQEQQLADLALVLAPRRTRVVPAATSWLRVGRYGSRALGRPRRPPGVFSLIMAK
jgi:hypothetical protein